MNDSNDPDKSPLFLAMLYASWFAAISFVGLMYELYVQGPPTSWQRLFFAGAVWLIPGATIVVVSFILALLKRRFEFFEWLELACLLLLGWVCFYVGQIVSKMTLF